MGSLLAGSTLPNRRNLPTYDPTVNLLNSQVLQLLGKLGARNRRWLKEPEAVAFRDNPEHGLRIILTFHPTSQSFLVPMDRCIALVRGAVSKADPGAHLPSPGLCPSISVPVNVQLLSCCQYCRPLICACCTLHWRRIGDFTSPLACFCRMSSCVSAGTRPMRTSIALVVLSLVLSFAQLMLQRPRTSTTGSRGWPSCKRRWRRCSTCARPETAACPAAPSTSWPPGARRCAQLTELCMNRLTANRADCISH